MVLRIHTSQQYASGHQITVSTRTRPECGMVQLCAGSAAILCAGHLPQSCNVDGQSDRHVALHERDPELIAQY
jgi:hypothetical protein